MLRGVSVSFIPRVCIANISLYKNTHIAQALRPKGLASFEPSLYSRSISMYFLSHMDWVCPVHQMKPIDHPCGSLSNLGNDTVFLILDSY